MTCANCTDRCTCCKECDRLRAAMPSTGDDREIIVSSTLIDRLSRARRTFNPRGSSTGVMVLTWTEGMTGERPPDEWPRDKRMAFDHLVNRLTLAECARKYRVNKWTAKSRLAKVCKDFSPDFS